MRLTTSTIFHSVLSNRTKRSGRDCDQSNVVDFDAWRFLVKRTLSLLPLGESKSARLLCWQHPASIVGVVALFGSSTHHLANRLHRNFYDLLSAVLAQACFEFPITVSNSLALIGWPKR